MSDVQTAQTLGDKLKIWLDDLELVQQLYDEIETPFDFPLSYKIDQEWDLIVRPGWGVLNTLADLPDFIFLAKRKP